MGEVINVSYNPKKSAEHKNRCENITNWLVNFILYG